MRKLHDFKIPLHEKEMKADINLMKETWAKLDEAQKQINAVKLKFLQAYKGDYYFYNMRESHSVNDVKIEDINGDTLTLSSYDDTLMDEEKQIEVDINSVDLYIDFYSSYPTVTIILR